MTKYCEKAYSNIATIGDRVLIRRIDEPSANIRITDQPKGIKGIVLATGPGKWIPGEWWPKRKFESNAYYLDANDWEWESGHYRLMSVRPGMSVLFNSKWNDFSGGELVGTGADLKGPLVRPLPLLADPTLHLVTEGDIFCIIPDIKVSASIKSDAISQQFSINKEIVGPWNGGDPNTGVKQIHHG